MQKWNEYSCCRHRKHSLNSCWLLDTFSGATQRFRVLRRSRASPHTSQLITQADQCLFISEYVENTKSFHIFLVCFYEVCSDFWHQAMWVNNGNQLDRLLQKLMYPKAIQHQTGWTYNSLLNREVLWHWFLQESSGRFNGWSDSYV